MKTFFNHIFYELFKFYQWQDEFWERLGATNIHKGDLFHPVFALSCLQCFNATSIVIFVAIQIGFSQYMKNFHYIYVGILGVIYFYNYIYYQRRGMYKEIIREYSKMKRTVVIAILYSILSLIIVIFAFCSIPM